MIEIEKISNGYLITTGRGDRVACESLLEVFERLLVLFEGKSKMFHGSLYSQVVINEIEPNE